MKAKPTLFDWNRDTDMLDSRNPVLRLILRSRSKLGTPMWELEGRGRNEVTLFTMELQARSDALEVQRVLFPGVQTDFV